MINNISNFDLNAASEIKNGIYKTEITGLFFVKQTHFQDDRGFFSEIAKVPDINSITGNDFVAKQINHARSFDNVVRGIHSEGWNKLIFVTQGVCFCALVDLRRESDTYKKVQTFVLGIGEGALSGSLYVPIGVGNSYAVINGPLDYVYIVDRLYKDRDKSGDKAISLFDPELNIKWPILEEKMIISDRDKNSITINQINPK